MEKALGRLLSNNNVLVAATKGKISPLKRDDYPSVTYEKSGREVSTDIMGNEIGPIRTTFTIVSRAKSYKEAKDIAKMIEQALKPPFETVNGLRIYLAEYQDESEGQQNDPDITEITLTYTFHHTEVAY